MALVVEEPVYRVSNSQLYPRLALAFWACNELLLRLGAPGSVCYSY